MTGSVRQRDLIATSLVACFLLFGAIPALAMNIPAPYDTSYTFVDLGPVPGLPTNYGGLVFKQGDPSKLLIGGAANGASGKIYEIALVRDIDGHVTGFSGTATAVIDAPYNDGGVLYGPDGVLFLARWPVNELGQVKPGSATTDKVINMDDLTDESLSAMNFPPTGFPGEGRLKMAVYDNGKWYDTTIIADGLGTFNLGTVTNVPGSTLGGDGPEGWIYVVPGSPVFDPTKNYMLLSAYSADEVVAYELDSNGDPVVSTRSIFLDDLSGAEGAAIDPVTGDFFFSTFGDVNTVVRVEGFLPPPTDTDNDGVPDSADNCPNDANPGQENNEADALGDACDPDDDNDNIADLTDQCPLVQETVNGFEDADGCPDVAPTGDADNDGVPDDSDLCPTEPGPPTNNGCPVRQIVGGEILNVEMNSLFVAGAFANSGWISLAAGTTVAAIAVLVMRRRLKN